MLRPLAEEHTMAQTYIGAPIRRREDVRFLTGKATFVDDIKLPHMLYAAILRSTHAHARITAIETSRPAPYRGWWPCSHGAIWRHTLSPSRSGSIPCQDWSIFCSMPWLTTKCAMWA